MAGVTVGGAAGARAGACIVGVLPPTMIIPLRAVGCAAGAPGADAAGSADSGARAVEVGPGDGGPGSRISPARAGTDLQFNDPPPPVSVAAALGWADWPGAGTAAAAAVEDEPEADALAPGAPLSRGVTGWLLPST